jgi:2-polyprenyl-3-methyl-5-hydroxy-6-metoxy-1,4-benzoquinol methylase
MPIKGLKSKVVPPQRDPLLLEVRAAYETHYRETYGEEETKGLYRNADWRRLQYALELIPKKTQSVLDVGVGPGALLNILTLSERFQKVVGIDVRQYSKFLPLSESLNFDIMSVADMSFADSSFDVVICMEVLEHLKDELLEPALHELRRVCGGLLIMSVPYEEPEPLPSYHLQRFDEARLRQTFPDAETTLLYRTKQKEGWPWAILLEDHSR